MEILDRSCLQYTVKPGENLLFRDKDTDELIGQAVSNVLPLNEIPFMERGVEECLNAGNRRSIRVVSPLPSEWLYEN